MGGGEVLYGFELAGFEFWVIVENFGFGGARGEPAEDVPGGDGEGMGGDLALQEARGAGGRANVVPVTSG